MVKTFHAGVDMLYRLIELVMVLCIATMLVMVFGNVVLRLFFNTGIDLSEEIPRFAFVWMTFLGAIIGMKKRAHLGVDVIVKLLPVPGQKICWGLSQFIMAVCCMYIVYGTYLQHDIIKGNASPVAQISMLWVFGVSYISGTAIGLICLSNLVRLVRGQVDESELCDVMEEGMSDVEIVAQDMRHQTATATPAGSKP
jgi:TRAP-type C4-dicarboxylate transport system permease small subunit